MFPGTMRRAMSARSQPPADGRLVGRILLLKFSFEKPFFSWDHDDCDEGRGGDEREEQPKIIKPNRQSDQEQDKRQIDGITTEPVGTCSDDRGRGFRSTHGG